MAFNQEDLEELSANVWKDIANGRSYDFGIDTAGLIPQFNQLGAGAEPTVFTYPMDMMKEKTDHLAIKIYEKVRAEDVFGFGKVEKVEKASDLNISKDDFLKLKSFTDSFNDPSKAKELEKNARFIFLPIPQQVSDAISVSYAEDTLNPLQAAGLKATAALIDNPSELLKAGQKITDSLSENLDPGTISALKAALSGQALNSLGANVSSAGIIGRATGQILQSNLELLFSGVTLRSFPFVYDFTPRDPREAEVVKAIIRTLKKAMVPKGGSIEGGRNALFIQSPDVFALEYKSGNENHPFLNSFKICVLTDMSVNYTASGTYATYGDASPVHIQVQMTFKEINPVYAEDYDNLSKGGYKNVGY